MSQDQITTLIGAALLEILWLAMPMLGLGLIVGLVISIVQATTQINEQTIVFVAKILSVFVGLILFGSWMLVRLGDFTLLLFESIIPILRS